MRIDNFKQICVVGWGKSGIALTRLLLSLKKKVKVSEIKERTSFDGGLIAKFQSLGVEFEFGGHTLSFIKGAELLVLSPGVNINSSPCIKIAHQLDLLCIGEIELSFWLSPAKFIAITGTNGKTTTTFLTYRLLKTRYKGVFLGGNIGIPLSSFILQAKKESLVVLEVSSFQLQTILEFRPLVAALTNLEPNHLDHHSSFREYFLAKMRIFQNQRKEDWAVLNRGMNLLSKVEAHIRAKKVYFGEEFPNENFSCAFRIAKIFRIEEEAACREFSNFKGLPHRLEFVRSLKGISFINDSKSTNPSSTLWALKNIRGMVILMAGGSDKGVDYSLIKAGFRKIKKINLIGEAADKIKEALSDYVRIERFSSLEEAITSSFKEAEKNETVLFSPMCSSFDMFKNYIERGKRFKEIVQNLKE